MEWRENLLSSGDRIRRLLMAARTIAVLGIKTEAQAGEPAYYVPEYLASVGYDVIPVPVYYPEATRILGQQVVRTLAAIETPIDIVDVFRSAKHLFGHLEDMLAARPRAIWLQSGIRDDAFAQALARAGIQVVQDRCLMVEHRRLIGTHHV